QASPYQVPVAAANVSGPVTPVWSIYLAIGLSGFSALGAEVVWTRLLSLLIGGTVYTFSIILAVFLIGLGVGSSAGSFAAREVKSPRAALGICQLLLAAAVAWTAYMLAKSLPYWPIDPSIAKNPWHNFQLDMARCLWAVLPAALLWGASFPLALAAAAGSSHLAPRDADLTRSVRNTIDPGRLVGSIYAANTVGAIVGALLFSVLLVGWVATPRSQQILIGIAVPAALIPLVPLLFSQQGTAASGALRGALVTAALGLSAALAWTVPKTPGELIAHGRRLPSRKGQY